MQYLFENELSLMKFAGKLANFIPRETVIYLHGPLGAGKTTFVRGFLQGLGYQDKVKSPTYTLVEPYHIEAQTYYHFDLYRLKQAEELEFLGIEEFFKLGSICLIEWPEKGFPLLPAADLDCYIDFKDEGRVVRLAIHDKRLADLSEKL